MLALLATPGLASAQQDEVGTPHYLLTASAGVPLRLTRNVDFDQGTIAPVFTDAFFAYAFAAPGTFHHGLGLGASLNLSEDGGYTEPVLLARQWVLMPAYTAFWTLDSDWLMLGHLGLPILLHGGRSIGVEVANGVGYRMLSGVGFFGEAGLQAFPGADATLHLSFSLELGLFMDYEVLP